MQKIVSFVGVDGCLEACHWWIFGSSALIAHDPVPFVGSNEIAKPLMTTAFFTATGWSYVVIISCKQRACLPLLTICNMVSSFRKSHAFQVLVLFMWYMCWWTKTTFSIQVGSQKAMQPRSSEEQESLSCMAVFAVCSRKVCMFFQVTRIL
jgi:hypothetical protein